MPGRARKLIDCVTGSVGRAGLVLAVIEFSHSMHRPTLTGTVKGGKGGSVDVDTLFNPYPVPPAPRREVGRGIVRN